MGLFGRTSLAIVLVSLSVLSTAHAEATIEAASGGKSHDSVWRSADVGLYLDASLWVLPDALESVSSALEVWSSDSRLPHVWPLLGSTDSVGYREGQTNRNTIRFATGGEPAAKGALAITLVSYKGDEQTIVDGDIVINGLYCFDDLRAKHGSEGSGKRPVYDLTDVLLHELGHWFGLADAPDDPLAIMYPYFDAGETRALSLGDGDRQALEVLYGTGEASSPAKPACSIGGPRRGGNSYTLMLVALAGLGWWRAASASRERHRI